LNPSVPKSSAQPPSLQLFRGPLPVTARQPCALAIGNFDGVHLGHQTILRHLCQEAAARGLVPTVMTFEPHPRAFFARKHRRPELSPTRLTGLRDQVDAFAQTGIERLVIERFNEKLAELPAETFIRKLLIEQMQVKWLLVGDDFRFGAHRGGDITLLRRMAPELGYEVQAMSSITDPHGQRISSSAIRHALASGQLALATQLLGRPYSISGHVAHGRKLGRSLGFPTLNLRVPHQRPALSGIFTVWVHGLAEHPLPGVASLGVRPTIEANGRAILEVHVLDYHGDAYGKLVRVEFLEKSRDELKFTDLDSLQRAIANDIVLARRFFASLPPGARPPAISATDRI